MMYVVIGLGNFGVALSEKLTAMGHEVIGVDSNINLVEEYKNSIGSTICVNIADESSLQMLPLSDADEVVVALGEHVGNSVLVVALLKQYGVKRLVARASNKLHRTILEAIGVDEVLMPELHAADLYALSSESKQIKSAFVIDEAHQIIEMEIPKILVTQSVSQVNFEGTFNVSLIAVKRRKTKLNVFGKNSFLYEMENHESADFLFEEFDRVLLFGDIKSLQKIERQLF